MTCQSKSGICSTANKVRPILPFKGVPASGLNRNHAANDLRTGTYINRGRIIFAE